jgi:glycosidase
VVLDIVLNHMARVFDYWRSGALVHAFKDEGILRSAPLSGLEPEIAWLGGLGFPRSDWTGPPMAPGQWQPDDGVHPAADFRKDFFRRRGEKASDHPDWPSEDGGLAVGDFGVMRQLAVEYQADKRDPLYQRWGANPVLTLLVRAYSYLVARFDFDAFRIDTVKYVHPTMVQFFGNAIREFAQSIGKQNFYTVGEVWDDDKTIARFVGRNGNAKEGYGIDAAKDFPLFQLLKPLVKALPGGEVEKLPALFKERKDHEEELLSTHGEASRFFLTFLDNHDQKERFRHKLTPSEQVSMALGLLFSLQGIPCVYYGTEQDLFGTVDANGNPEPAEYEGVREALWGKPNAFATTGTTYQQIKDLADLRRRLPALRCGRQYFRPVSANGKDFGISRGVGGIVAFSRILGDEEVLVVANTSTSKPFIGYVLVDRTVNDRQASMKLAFSNRGQQTYSSAILSQELSFWTGDHFDGSAPGSYVKVDLKPMELQMFEQS